MPSATATATTTTTTMRQPKKQAVPVLLEAFPFPPNHIPPSPTSSRPLSTASLNPPPSLPPAAPLPPVPGPSPLSDQDTLLLLSSTRSRRSVASIRSLRSSPTNRDSILKDSPPCSPGGPFSKRASITSPRSSYSSASSLCPPTPSYPRTSQYIDPPSTYPISEEDSADTANRSCPPPSDDDEFSFSHLLPPSLSRLRQALHSPTRRSPPSDSSDLDLFSRNASSTPPRRPPKHSDPRSTSPDITTMLSRTPRPRHRTSSFYSNSSSADSRTPRRENPQKSYSDASTISRRASEGSALGSSLPYYKPEQDVGSWNDHSFVSDHGVPIPDDHVDPVLDSRLERKLDGNASDSDSSLDLHTPLPHLMVRKGFLSPNSKLIMGRSLSPGLAAGDNPRGSVFSIASNVSTVTKSGIMKDERDTPKRRDRHRDGRLLRGGVGLTTGLGWSDSEDEDAPSALTRRLSTLNLSHRSSVGNSFSKSYSGSSAPPDDPVTPSIKRPASLGHKKATRIGGSIPTTAHRRRASSGRAASPAPFDVTLSTPEQRASYPLLPAAVTRRAREAVKDLTNSPSTTRPSFSTSDLEKGLPPLPGKPALRRFPAKSSLKPHPGGDVPVRPGSRSRRSSSASSISSTDHHYTTTTTTSTTMTTTTSTTTGASSMPPLPASSAASTHVPPRPLHLAGTGVRAATATAATTATTTASSSIGAGAGNAKLAFNRNVYDQQRMRNNSAPARPSASADVKRSAVPPPPPVTSAHSTGTMGTSPAQVLGSTAAVVTPRPRPRTGTGMVYRTSSYGSPSAILAGSRMRMPVNTSLSSGPPAQPQPIAL